MELWENLKDIDNIEFYITVFVFLFTLWFIRNTILYYKGEKRNVKHLHRFAKEGEVDAQHHLAKRYQKGDMVKKSSNRAAFWYQRASFLGDDVAKDSLEKIIKKKKN